jgi:hypothetical protein
MWNNVNGNVGNLCLWELGWDKPDSAKQKKNNAPFREGKILFVKA